MFYVTLIFKRLGKGELEVRLHGVPTATLYQNRHILSRRPFVRPSMAYITPSTKNIINF